MNILFLFRIQIGRNFGFPSLFCVGWPYIERSRFCRFVSTQPFYANEPMRTSQSVDGDISGGEEASSEDALQS
jgi:hypothetical protein